MAISFGSGTIADVKFGGDSVSEIRFGGALVWSSGPQAPPPPATTPSEPTNVAVSVEPNSSLFIDESLSDESGNGLTLTWGSGVTLTSSSKSGSYAVSVVGDSQSARVVLPSDSLLNFGSGDYTVEAWVKVGTMDQYASFLHRTASSSVPSVEASAIRIGAPMDNGAAAIVADNPGFYSVVLKSTTDLRDSQWHHVAFTRSGGTTRIFIDGSEEASTTTAMPPVSFSGGHLFDASGYYANNNDNEWTGTVDRLKIIKGQALYTSSFTPPF